MRAAAGSNVTYIPADQVKAAFAKGAVLINNGSYQVHASRREEPGQVEVHVKDTDIIYMLEGSTTFVTGGTMVGGKTTAPDEIRGSNVTGRRDAHAHERRRHRCPEWNATLVQSRVGSGPLLRREGPVAHRLPVTISFANSTGATTRRDY